MSKASARPTILAARCFAGLMGKIQEENACTRTGNACRVEAEKCGCWLEAWGEIDNPKNDPAAQAPEEGA